MSHSFFTPGAKLSLKEICKAPRLCGKWSNFFGRPWRCLQMEAETAWTLKSSFVGAMPIENRPPLSLYQNLLRIFFYVVSTNHIFERGHWIAKLPEIMENEFASVLLFTSITFHSSASQKMSSNPTILHRLVTSYNTIRVMFSSPLLFAKEGTATLKLLRTCPALIGEFGSQTGNLGNCGRIRWYYDDLSLRRKWLLMLFSFINQMSL